MSREGHALVCWTFGLIVHNLGMRDIDDGWMATNIGDWSSHGESRPMSSVYRRLWLVRFSGCLALEVPELGWLGPGHLTISPGVTGHDQ